MNHAATADPGDDGDDDRGPPGDGAASLEESLGIGDLDELLREVDRRCDRRDWEGVRDVGRRARAAIERGHQLWPATSYAEYRLALEAPPRLAASVVHEGAGWMAPGPLTEVVAQNHSFGELAAFLDHGPPRSVVAAERVVRGEEVELSHPEDELPGGIPSRLCEWEPEYSLAVYSPTGAQFEPPHLGAPGEAMRLTSAGDAGAQQAPDPDAGEGADCLVEALRHWSTQSEGTVRASGVVGDQLDALAALGHGSVMWRPADLAEAGALLAWGAADGAAHGRRRGAAAGRFELWWTLAVLCGIDDSWPVDPGPAASELRFGLWLPEGSASGWSCRITVADPLDGLAWALDASDTGVA